MKPITIDILDAARAFKIDQSTIDVAKKVTKGLVKPFGKDMRRSDRDKWELFKKFSDVIGFLPADTINALEDNLDDTYVSPAEVTNHRISVAYKMVEKMRKELEKAHSYTQSIVEALIVDVGTIQPTAYISNQNTIDDIPTTVMADFSDWHIGSAWQSNETGFGEMSTKILEDRVEKLTRKVINLTNLQRRISPINRLITAFLGDIAENSGMHYGSAVHTDNPTIRQVSAAINASEKMFISFLKEFEEVLVPCVYGNHGRIGNKGEAHPLDNWDVLIYSFLAERFKNEPRIKFFISTTPYMAFILEDQENYCHMLCHGDGVPAPLGIPLYSISRAESNVTKLLDRSINYSHFAHFHNAASIDKTHGSIFINGSLVGTSPFGISLKLAGQAQQSLRGFHPVHGMTFHYPMYLETHEIPQPDSNGIITPYIEGIQGL